MTRLLEAPGNTDLSCEQYSPYLSLVVLYFSSFLGTNTAPGLYCNVCHFCSSHCVGDYKLVIDTRGSVTAYPDSLERDTKIPVMKMF